jgi:hypothetical protein
MKSDTILGSLFIGGVLAVLAFAVLTYVTMSGLRSVGASTIQGNEYQEINFAASNVYGASTTAGTIKTGYGSLGSVVITGAAAGVLNFYDATTTNATKRDATQATSTLLVASLPASLAAGTYTFDVTFSRGLIVDIIGTAPTSTVTFR